MNLLVQITFLSFILVLLPSPSWAECHRNTKSIIDKPNNEDICAFIFDNPDCEGSAHEIPNGREESNFNENYVRYKRYNFYYMIFSELELL